MTWKITGSSASAAGNGATNERVGDLDENPRTVTGVGVRALGPAVLEVLERIERLLDDRVARLTPQLGDERHVLDRSS